MNTPIADAYNNPFLIDGKTSPPARSALAILNVDRDELDRRSIDQILQRALAAFEDDPESALVYGRPVQADDLKAAADRLRDPKSLIINEIIDPPCARFDISDLPELKEALAEFKQRVSAVQLPKLSNPGVIGHLLLGLVRPPVPPRTSPLRVAKPDLPTTDDLLSGLA